MTVPRVPGKPLGMPDWWSEQDQRILAGAVAEIDALPRAALPQRTPAIPAAVPPAPRTRPTVAEWLDLANPLWRYMGALVLAAVVVLALVVLGTANARPMPSPCPGEASGCADFATPTTYGPPGPAGGFTSMPARGD